MIPLLPCSLSFCGSVHHLLSAHVIWVQLVLLALEEGLIGLTTQQVLPLAIVTGLQVEMTQLELMRVRLDSLSNCWEKAFSFLFHIEHRGWETWDCCKHLLTTRGEPIWELNQQTEGKKVELS